MVDGAQQGGKYGAENQTVSTEERSGRVDHFRQSADDSLMFSAECQAEKRNLDTGISLIYEFKPRMNKRFLWNALKQAEKKNKIL